VQQFLKWTLEQIRKEGSMMSWMEEKRFEWVPLTASMLKRLLDGHTFIVISDDECEWFCHYMTHSINHHSKHRPLIPFVSLQSLYPNLAQIKTKEDIELLENLLLQLFPAGYTFFYVGKNSDVKMQIAKRKDDSFIWVMDEHLQNSFYLQTSDDTLDIKLIQLFKLLDKSIDAVLFAEVTFENE
jgi:hypothetical protein